MRTRWWTIVVLGSAVTAGFVLSLKPWQAYRQQRAIADQKIAEQQKAERSLVDLTERKARVENPVGREKQARDHGFRREGEETID